MNKNMFVVSNPLTSSGRNDKNIIVIKIPALKLVISMCDLSIYLEIGLLKRCKIVKTKANPIGISSTGIIKKYYPKIYIDFGDNF